MRWGVGFLFLALAAVALRFSQGKSTYEDLPRGDAVFSGQVTDAGGAAISGAEIYVFRIGLRGREARSSASGRFVLRDLPHLELIVSVEAPGYCWLTEDVWMPALDVPLVLRRPCTLHGVVSDGNDRPVPGARVSAGRFCRPTGDDTVLTDGRGEFTMEGLRPGTHEVTATVERREGRKARAVVTVTLAEGEARRDVRVRLNTE